MRNPEEHWQARRAQILEAATQLLADDGASKLTIRSVAARAHVDPALIYHYFHSKDDLVRSVIAIPLELETSLLSRRGELGAQLALLDQSANRRWVTALFAALPEERELASAQLGHVLDLLLPEEETSKRAMLLGFLVARFLLAWDRSGVLDLNLLAHLVGD